MSLVRIIVITDVHGNLPAFEAALKAADRLGYDLIVHTGDVIGIGPFPSECLERLLSLERARPVMGNHDEYLVEGLSERQTSRMEPGELVHQRWTVAQLDPKSAGVVGRWPYVFTAEWEGVTLSFLHYPLRAEKEYIPIMLEPTPQDMDRAFAEYPGSLIFYGHHHPFSDITGERRYINPGSLGCWDEAVARFAVVDINKGSWSVRFEQAPYDDQPLVDAFRSRQVPERDFINRVFLGGRLKGPL